MASSKKKDTILLLIKNDEKCTSIQKALGNAFHYQRAISSIDAFSRMTFNMPSLIIAETENPDIKIYDLLQTIRNGIKTKLIPFIIIASSDDSSNRIQAIEKGVDAFLVYPFIPEELNVVVNSILNRIKEFYLLSITDELTRLYNRREFIKKFREEIENTDKITSLAIIDIDHFKKINDVYGHQTGDLVLMRLADILKKHSSDTFFPARFGGEEFVILFPGIDNVNSKEHMEVILDEFSSIDFEHESDVFNVTFSGGIAEFPTMGRNASELLSRSDQALYAAKNDGRNLIYSFSPIMARNDKFWEFLKIKKDSFINNSSFDPITNLPYLPQMLESISNLDFEVQSVGVLIISVKPIYDIEDYKGYLNYSYDLENIKMIISKSTELIFPSDNYIGIANFFTYEFIILFPSVVDFTFNLVKFREICKDISHTINGNLKENPIDLSYTSDVLQLNSKNPRKIYHDINSIRLHPNPLSDKHRIYSAYQKSLKNISKNINIEELIGIKNYYDMRTGEISYNSFSLKNTFEYVDLFGPLCNEKFNKPKSLKSFFKHCYDSNKKEITAPLLIPYVSSFSMATFIKGIIDIFGEKEIIIMVNEYLIQNNDISSFSTFSSELPDSISFGIDDCYIGNDILNIVSQHNFSLLCFSENITNNIYRFKNRMKVINGLTIFLEQISVPSIAKNIKSEEEYHIIQDLNIDYSSGQFLDIMHKPKRKKR